MSILRGNDLSRPSRQILVFKHLSLTPGFSRVTQGKQEKSSRFNGFCVT
jgi:hypothetical protein